MRHAQAYPILEACSVPHLTPSLTSGLEIKDRSGIHKRWEVENEVSSNSGVASQGSFLTENPKQTQFNSIRSLGVGWLQLQLVSEHGWHHWDTNSSFITLLLSVWALSLVSVYWQDGSWELPACVLSGANSAENCSSPSQNFKSNS